MQRILSIKNIAKCYNNKGNEIRGIDNISFEVEKGEFIGIMGKTGSGKTTLLNCISTIDSATLGHIIIKDNEIANLKPKDQAKFRREEIGFIFQEYCLIETLTAYENIEMALIIEKENPFKIHGMINNVAKKLGVYEVLNKYPSELSDGENQSIAIARAIVTNPALILADEPTEVLDSKATKRLLDSFKEINTEFEATILLVTHDPNIACYCKRILFLEEGKIFNELIRGNDTQNEFYNRVIEVISH